MLKCSLRPQKRGYRLWAAFPMAAFITRPKDRSSKTIAAFSNRGYRPALSRVWKRGYRFFKKQKKKKKKKKNFCILFFPQKIQNWKIKYKKFKIKHKYKKFKNKYKSKKFKIKYNILTIQTHPENFKLNTIYSQYKHMHPKN